MLDPGLQAIGWLVCIVTHKNDWKSVTRIVTTSSLQTKISLYTQNLKIIQMGLFSMGILNPNGGLKKRFRNSQNTMEKIAVVVAKITQHQEHGWFLEKKRKCLCAMAAKGCWSHLVL